MHLIWSQLSHILVRECADARTSGSFYLAIVQYILIFGADAWVVTPCIVITVEDCIMKEMTCTNFRNNFGHFHVWDMIVIME